MATTLYRCKTPTNYFCPCGRVARRLGYAGIDYDQVRVRNLKRDRPEVDALTGQRWVPVLVHGDEVIHDSKRIIQYVEALGRERAPRAEGKASSSSGRGKGRAWLGRRSRADADGGATARRAG